ncbi:50S ribosomal protein L4 [Pelotalea chapellei]|uniref:Large ribosomal subunit protein uL4 n=1 Tax=Pelotalea chapellei TaxID=44671 RepID=A0ABS5UCL5_9BACT|nr:50S ribosomal protein L4 [Pelotalea chapellei]MBT1073389.1 50S ribosomal protein L4 [Pelotalea chapellei]
MPSIAVFNMDRQKVGEVELSEEVFNTEIKEYLMHLALRIQLANRRAGTVKTKTRSEVAGSNKKPFKQKGTGNARQGNVRAPQYPGGGVAFGPRPRDYTLSMNKKARNAALRSALSFQFKNERITVMDKLDFDAISTKGFVGFMKRFEIERSLIITDNFTHNLQLSCRNVPHIKLLKHDALNIHDMLKYKNIIITQSAVQSVEGALQK